MILNYQRWATIVMTVIAHCMAPLADAQRTLIFNRAIHAALLAMPTDIGPRQLVAVV
jgi:hypothetical protein